MVCGRRESLGRLELPEAATAAAAAAEVRASVVMSELLERTRTGIYIRWNIRPFAQNGA